VGCGDPDYKFNFGGLIGRKIRYVSMEEYVVQEHPLPMSQILRHREVNYRGRGGVNWPSCKLFS